MVKAMMIAAFALATAGAMPALAQMGTTSDSSQGSKMAAMKKCQAMPSAKMMKNKTCMKMAKMHPEMNTGM